MQSNLTFVSKRLTIKLDATEMRQDTLLAEVIASINLVPRPVRGLDYQLVGAGVQSMWPARIPWSLCWRAISSCATSALHLIALLVPMSIRHLLLQKLLNSLIHQFSQTRVILGSESLPVLHSSSNLSPMHSCQVSL